MSNKVYSDWNVSEIIDKVYGKKVYEPGDMAVFAKYIDMGDAAKFDIDVAAFKKWIDDNPVKY